ncbi:MAG TPA: hypothetical protein VHD83_20000 [Puia sp.]|nr:hypothetical protein [Puia sp.]
MSHFTDTYEIVKQITPEGVNFFFVSFGEREIIKVVRYSYITDFQGMYLYNLGFGDYNYRARLYSDDSVANNGDPYSVYHTVLATIPCFFQIYKDAMLMVQGSDSTLKFGEDCRIICTRKCPLDTCKKAHRRISIYRHYVDKHFEMLVRDYEFFGSFKSFENQLLIEDYIKDKRYLTILLKKRKFTI